MPVHKHLLGFPRSMPRLFPVVLALFLLTSVVSAQQTLTARDFYNELVQANTLPKWAQNVCFPEGAMDSEGHILTEDVGAFLLISGDDKLFRLRFYLRGNGGNVLDFRNHHTGENESEMVGRVSTRTGKLATTRFLINWATGRYNVETVVPSNRSDPTNSNEYGKCESIGRPERSFAPLRREYLGLLTAHRFPEWAENACFADEDDVPYFIVTGLGDRKSLPIRWYQDGAAGDTFYFARQKDDEHESSWSGDGQRDAKVARFTFRINWDTGRFLLKTEFPGYPKDNYVLQGECEGIK